MYRLVVSPTAHRQLKSIKKNHQLPIKLVIEEIKEDPTLGKRLARELTGKFSYRVGVYRIIYKVNEKDKVVSILTAKHRGEVYK